MSNGMHGSLLGARELLYACFALAIGSIMVVSVCVWLGIKSDIALTLSSLAMVGCIAVAFLATNMARAMDDSLTLDRNK